MDVDGEGCGIWVKLIFTSCKSRRGSSGPKPADEGDDHNLFRAELVNLIDNGHELVKLVVVDRLASACGQVKPAFHVEHGASFPTRLMAALLYLKHAFALSDEEFVERWCKNPYWQHSSRERYFRHELPCYSSSLLKRRSLDAIVLDSTVQPKAIPYPTDSRLLDCARELLVDAERRAGIVLR